MNEQDRRLWQQGHMLLLVPTEDESPETIRGRHGNGCYCSNCLPLLEAEEEEYRYSQR